MNKLIIIFTIWLLAGCELSDFRDTYVCKDGVLYLKQHGAWIQARYYLDNKCLPVEKEEQ